MPLIELELEQDGLLEMDLLGNFIGSAYSPQVDVTDTDTGHEVAITYMAPGGLVTERFDVANGEQGPQGPAGFSPTVSITDTPTGHTVTITDEDGPHSYDVPNYAQEEQARQQAWDALSREVTDAISDAETATSAATTAAQSATSAATSATSAAQAATTAAASANSAASAATSAATAANSAATAAGTAADAATTAAGDATDAASAANTAAQAAQEAAAALRPEVTWLRGNQLTKELNGELMQASDAYGAPVLSLGVDGKSTQDGTPTPDAPVEIVSVEGVELMLSGMNIFDKVYASDQSNWRVASYRSIGWYVGVGVPVTFSYENAKVENLLSNSNIYFGPRQGTASGNMIMFNPSHHETSKRGTAISGANGYVYLNVYPNSENAVSAMLATIADVLQIEVGSTAHSYAPYTEEISTVPLYDGTLRSLPDGTKDTLALSYLRPSTREGWAWYTPTLTTYVLEFTKTTGFGQFHATSSGHNRVRLAATGAAAAEGHSLCNRFVYNSSTYNNGVPGDYYISGDYMYCIVPDAITTIEGANAWLTENPITLVYRNSPPTPTVTTLDPIELPVLPAPDVTVWSDPTTGLQMEYVRDTSIVIASLEAAYADLATS